MEVEFASNLETIGAVVIGRNEGQRLLKCITSIRNSSSQIVYVDSGSADDSVVQAKLLGCDVVSLDMNFPFTAARARNAGLQFLLEKYEGVEFVQFVDGDCELNSRWITCAHNYLLANANYAIACGRRRERFPEQTVYNSLCDIEWNTPIGDAKSCGGDALIRASAILNVDGYRDTLIAGEEPEMCYRLRQKNWKVVRLDKEMALHDAAITKLSQWWQRSKRAGYAYMASALLHGRAKERFRVREVIRILFWGGTLPAVFIAGLVIPLLSSTVLLVYLIQYFRLRRQAPTERNLAAAWAFFLILGKFPEFLGVAKCLIDALFTRQSTIIEYK